MSNRSGYYFVDWERAVANSRDMTNTELVQKTRLSKNTLLRMQRGESIQKKSAIKALHALGIQNVDDFLTRADSLENSIPKTIRDPRRRFQSWQLLGEPIEMRSPNGFFTYRIGKAEHTHDKRIARTKCYDFESFSQEKIDYLHEAVLARHRDICLKLKKHPCFPEYIDSGFVGGTTFWIVETWEDGETLTKQVSRGAVTPAMIPGIAKQLAESLLALHDCGVIRRELTPDFIMIRESDCSLLLTDFEMARISGAAPSRPMDWVQSPYLSPQVDSPNVDFKTDLFSWAQIVIFCLTSKRPPKMSDAKLLSQLTVPKNVFGVLDSCLQTNIAWRPDGFRQVLDAIENWN